MTYRNLFACLLFSVVACGTTASQNPEGAGLGGVGNGIASAGSGAILAGAAGTDNNAGASGTTTCAKWPAEALFPMAGPWFYGPDPGPCTREVLSVGQVYVYEYDRANLLLSEIGDLGGILLKTEYRYEGARIVEATSASWSDVIDYGTASMVVTSSDGVTLSYELDALGYPLRLVYDQDGDGVGDGYASYVYENCRWIKKVSMDASGNALADQEQTAKYDSAGHLVEVNTANRATTRFTYDCWSK